jgi:hypothetical protein
LTTSTIGLRARVAVSCTSWNIGDSSMRSRM